MFVDELPSILRYIKDLIIIFGETSIIEMEIFLLIRILFLKFSEANLIQLLRQVWPIIFTELVMNNLLLLIITYHKIL